MCGIFAIYDFNGNINITDKFLKNHGSILKHRGPDDYGVFFDRFCAFSFRRLSIIDLSSKGSQPMYSDDKRFVIVFNGELFNYIEIRSLLRKEGVHFKSNSDTEVLLKLFIHFGENFTKYIQGMYAFLIWDRLKHELHICRDRLGIKPLYITKKNNQMIISSEIKGILKYIPSKNMIDESTIFNYLAKGWSDDTNNTFYQDIKSFPKATYMKICDGKMSTDTYWELPENGQRKYDQGEFRDFFFSNTKLHLQSDVPVATTLSGGMDSSSITAISALYKNTIQRLTAFSAHPPETYNESRWINQIVNFHKLDHKYLKLENNNVSDIINTILSYHDEPFLSSDCIYQFLLRKQISNNGYKVLLVGEGGDELLGGYKRLLYPFLYSLKKDKRESEYINALNGSVEFMGMSSNSVLKGLDNYNNIINNSLNGQENISSYKILNKKFINQNQAQINKSFYPNSNHKNLFIAHLKQHLTQRHVPYILRMEDRNSMAFNIETRVPFLDHRLIEFVFSHDYAEFMKGGINKSLLRRTMKDDLPSEVTNRFSKSPRPGNNSHIVYKILYKEMLNILKNDKLYDLGFLKNDITENFIDDKNVNNNNSAEIWFRIYNLYKWCS